MNRNIIALYLVKLSKWFSLVMPIIVLFYEEHGLGLHDVFVLKSVYSVAAVALEIPSGYLADVWGRKRCLLLGCLLFFGGYACYSFTSTFAAFLCAELLLGMGQTLVNGADSALLYDTLLRHKREEEYFRYEGRMTMVGNFAEATAGILGGLLAVCSLRYPFYAQACVAFMGIPAALSLQEFTRVGQVQNPWKEMARIIRYSLVTDRALCSNILYSGAIGAATLTMAWFVQPFLMHINTPTKWFGIIWTVLNLTVGVAALGSDRIQRKWKGYINQLTFSEMRATVLSIRNFVIRLMFAGVAPFVGWLNDTYSLRAALLASAALFFLPGFLFWWWGRK